MARRFAAANPFLPGATAYPPDISADMSENRPFQKTVTIPVMADILPTVATTETPAREAQRAAQAGFYAHRKKIRNSQETENSR